MTEAKPGPLIACYHCNKLFDTVELVLQHAKIEHPQPRDEPEVKARAEADQRAFARRMYALQQAPVLLSALIGAPAHHLPDGGTVMLRIGDSLADASVSLAQRIFDEAMK